MRSDFRGILIMTDLDGTFLGRDSKPVARNLAAVRRFMDGGGLFSFATGRVHTTIASFVLPGWQELINCPAIMCNGVCVYDPKAEKVLFETVLDGKAARADAARLFRTGKFRTNLYAGGDYHCYKNTDPHALTTDHWHKVVFVGEPEDVNEGWEMLAEENSDAYRFFRSSPHILEMLPTDGGKGPMLRRLKAWYGEQGRVLTTIGLGDYENDFDLLEQADVAVCPSNAIDGAKARADYIFCDNSTGVIADLIEAIERGDLL